LYLIGEDMDEHKLKTFAVPRMKSAVMSDDPYEGDVVDPKVLFESAFGIFQGGEVLPIKLRFDKTVSPYIKERRWHKSQKIVNKEDGSVELSLETSISPELIQWVLGFGESVTVIGPDELTKQLCEQAQSFLNKHAKATKAS
jgi:predicted DNA-binding transcriptional regulator YafY